MRYMLDIRMKWRWARYGLDDLADSCIAKEASEIGRAHV